MIKLYLLKPGLTTISATDTDTSTIGSVTTNTITLAKNVYANCEFPTKTSSVRSDWIYVTRGTYSYCWKILNCTNDNPSIITIDGLTTGLSLTAGDAVAIRSAVGAGECNWTSESTVTYVQLECESFDEQNVNEIKITRYVNAGAVIVNMKKYSDTAALGKWIVGNLHTDQTQAYAPVTPTL